MDMKRLVEEALQKKKQKDTRGRNKPFISFFTLLLMNTNRCYIRFEKKEDVGKGDC